jgi:putative FmdB family regulatory protein
MPIYEYICNICEIGFEVFHKSYRNQRSVECSTCSSEDVTKQISKVSFKLGGPTSSSDDYSADSSNIGKNVESTFSSHGIDMPDSIRRTIDGARGGKMPDGLDI